MIFQQHAGGREGRSHSLLRLWPFWLVLVVFETALWLLLALKFRQPCAPVAVAAGLTLGVAVQMGGGRGLRGLVVALALTALTIGLVLYGLASFHVARVLGLPPLGALASTGPDFALAVLDGLLQPPDWWFVAAGFVFAAVFGFDPVRRRAASAP